MINCMIVEDEPLAQQVIRQFVLASPDLELVAICGQAEKARTILLNTNVDLLFLDIKMPGLNGVEFLKSLTNPPAVIFTTAYSEYAVESYELNAVDYLLKPVSAERFNQAVLKYRNVTRPALSPAPEEHLFIKVNSDVVKLKQADILYMEARKDYILVITVGGSFLTHMTMKAMEGLLKDGFLRIHRSFIVSRRHISTWNKRFVLVNEVRIPVGESYRGKIADLISPGNDV